MHRSRFACWGGALLPLCTLLAGCGQPQSPPAIVAEASQPAPPQLLDWSGVNPASLRPILPTEVVRTGYPSPLASEPLRPARVASLPVPSPTETSDVQDLFPLLMKNAPSAPAPSVKPVPMTVEAARPEMLEAPTLPQQPPDWTEPEPLPPSIDDPAPVFRLEPAEIEPADMSPVTPFPPLAPMNEPPAAQSFPPSFPAQPDARMAPPWMQRAPRDGQMAAVAARADEMNRRAFDLAGHGALFSARSEFVQSLRLVSQALDAQQHTTMYGQALTRGLVALRESRDFLLRNGAAEQEIDVAHALSGHRTPVLKDVPADELTPLAALQRYYTFAQEQLAVAAGGEPTGSMALYGMGKVAVAQLQTARRGQIEGTAQAMVLYQAALGADPRNFRAANELGVLMAQNGQLEHARDLLWQSLSVSSQPAAWRNLASVHQRLGENDLALQAGQQAEMTGRSIAVDDGRKVRWVAPADFARYPSATDGLLQPTPAVPSAAPAAVQAQSPAGKKKNLGWIPWNQPARR